MISIIRQIDRLDWFNRASVVYLLLVVPLYWNFEAYDSTLWEKFLVAHIIVVRMAAGWLGVSWFGRDKVGSCFLDLPVLLYLGLVAFSWMSAINPLKSGMEVIRILLAATIYFSVSRTYRPEFRNVWLGAGSLSLAAVSFIGIVQYLGIGFLDWRSAGLPSSTFFYRNYAAMFVALALPLAVCGFALSRTETTRILHAVAATLGAIFLIYTRTRGAWLGVGFGIVALGIALKTATADGGGWRVWSDRLAARKRILSICGVILVCATLLPPGEKGELESLPLGKASAVEAFLSILAGQHSGRANTWIQSLGMIADYPLKGVGIGNWDAEYLRYAGPALAQDGGLFGRPHNDYLWVVTELGLPGLVLFLWIMGGGLWLVWRRLSTSEDKEELILMTALGAGIFAISVHAFFSFPRERMTATVISFLFLGWIGALDARSQERESSRPRSVWRPALLFALSLIALVPTIQVARSYRAYFWADAYRTFDRYEDSLKAIDAAIGYGVVDYRIYELKALNHYKMNDLQAALEASERLLEYHPYNPWSFQKLGLFQMELGNFEAAREAFGEAVRYAPGVGRIRRDLGQVYEALGFADSALVAYEKALKVVPSDALLRTKLASLLADQGEFDQAQEHIAAAAKRLRLTSVDQDVAVVGDVAMKAKAYDAAIMAYGRAATLVPDSADYQDKLAGALENGGNRNRAVVVLKRLLGLVSDEKKGDILRRIARIEAPPDGDG